MVERWAGFYGLEAAQAIAATARASPYSQCVSPAQLSRQKLPQPAFNLNPANC